MSNPWLIICAHIKVWCKKLCCFLVCDQECFRADSADAGEGSRPQRPTVKACIRKAGRSKGPPLPAWLLSALRGKAAAHTDGLVLCYWALHRQPREAFNSLTRPAGHAQGCSINSERQLPFPQAHVKSTWCCQRGECNTTVLIR